MAEGVKAHPRHADECPSRVEHAIGDLAANQLGADIGGEDWLGWAGVVRLPMRDQPCRHSRRQRDVAPPGAALQPPALAAVELLADLDMRVVLQLHVLPGQANHLGDSQPGMDEELEEEMPVLGDR